MKTVTILRQLSDRDLIGELFNNPADGAKIRQIITRRMFLQGVKHPADLYGVRQLDWVRGREPPQPRRILDVTPDNFPCMGEETVLDWMRELQPHEIATSARDEGFACSNMKDPDQARSWMNYAIADKSEWRQLPAGAWRFWKAFYQKWRMWKLEQGNM